MEVSGTLLRWQHYGGIAGSVVASGRPERAHRPIPPVKTGSKFREFQGHGMISGNTPVRDVG